MFKALQVRVLRGGLSGLLYIVCLWIILLVPEKTFILFDLYLWQDVSECILLVVSALVN